MAKDWQYGDAGDRIPVTTGTLWAAGPHLFACGDLTNHAHYTALLNPARTAIQIPLVYVDPPWNQSLLTGFRTKAKAPVSDLTFTEFLYTLLEPLSTLDPQPAILMEGSAQPKAVEAVTDAIDAIPNLAVRSIWNITYFGNKPGLLYQLGGHISEEDQLLTDTFGVDFHGMDDAHTPRPRHRTLHRAGQLRPRPVCRPGPHRHRLPVPIPPLHRHGTQPPPPGLYP